jgi:uncharacterized protein (DUF849 family)
MAGMAAVTLITVAPTGAETAKSDAPALPCSIDELVDAARACEAAGAAVIHVHLRDDDARPTLDLTRAKAAIAAIREATDLVVQISSGGAVTDSEADRLAVLDADPDGASLTCGTVNFGADVFMNRWEFIERLFLEMRDRQIVPEFELFDLGHVTTMRRLLDKHGEPFGGHVHADLVMGVPGGMPGTAAALVACVAALPPEATWSATGVGRTTLPVMLAALRSTGPGQRPAGRASCGARTPGAEATVVDNGCADNAWCETTYDVNHADRSAVMAQGNRRIDKVLAEGYSDALQSLPLEEVRERRHEAEQEEVDLSYLRRVLQGRLDILRAELARRNGEETNLVDALPRILADEGSVGAPRGLGRHTSVEPSRADAHRRHVEALIADVDLSNPSAHDDASLKRVLEVLEKEEHDVSEKRREVQKVMDALTAEITRRYREGDADVSALLPSEA